MSVTCGADSVVADATRFVLSREPALKGRPKFTPTLRVEVLAVKALV